MAQDELSKVLAGLRKGAKDTPGARIGTLTDAIFEDVLRPKPLSTGNLAVDAITSIGGLPKGRVIELFGPPSSGKTTTALQAMGLCQQLGGRVLFLDHERSLDETYVRALGLDPDGREGGHPTFFYDQPRHFEEGANVARSLMGFVDLIVTDSVAAMTTEGELNAKTGKVEFAARAKMMHQYMRQVVGPIADVGTTMVFLNHVQDVIDTSPMGQQMKARGITRQTTPGGSALKFYSSMRVSYKQIGNVRSAEYDAVLNENVSIPTQTKTQVTVVKNKVGTPFGQAEVRVRFGKGFSNEWSALDVLERHGKIKKDTGGVYRFLDDAIAPKISDGELVYVPPGVASGIKAGAPWVRGEDNVIALLEQDHELRGLAISAARDLVGKGWDVKASADEIAAAKAEEEGEKDALLDDLKNAGDASSVDEIFPSNDGAGKVSL